MMTPSCKPFSTEYMELIDITDFMNHKMLSIHVSGHMLEFALSLAEPSSVKYINICPVDINESDHTFILFSVDFPSTSSYIKTITNRNYSNTNQTVTGQESLNSLLLGLETRE